MATMTDVLGAIKELITVTEIVREYASQSWKKKLIHYI